MEGCDGTLDGFPDELTYRRYHRFGAGGAALIWGEATAIADEGRMNPRQLWIYEKTVPALTDMLAQCRTAHRDATGSDDGLLVGLQLTHSGRFAFRKPLIATRDPLLDPLTIDKSAGRPIGNVVPDAHHIPSQTADRLLIRNGTLQNISSESPCGVRCSRAGTIASVQGEFDVL